MTSASYTYKLPKPRTRRTIASRRRPSLRTTTTSISSGDISDTAASPSRIFAAQPTVGQPAVSSKFFRSNEDLTTATALDPAGETNPKFPEIKSVPAVTNKRRMAQENERPLKKLDRQMQTQRLADIQPQTTVQQEQQQPLRRTILQPKSCRGLASPAPTVAQLASKQQTSANTSISSNEDDISDTPPEAKAVPVCNVANKRKTTHESERPLKKPDRQRQAQIATNIQPNTVQEEQQTQLQRTILQPSRRELAPRALVTSQRQNYQIKDKGVRFSDDVQIIQLQKVEAHTDSNSEEQLTPQVQTSAGTSVSSEKNHVSDTTPIVRLSLRHKATQPSVSITTINPAPKPGPEFQKHFLEQAVPIEQTKPPSLRRSRRSTRNYSSKASRTGPKVEIATVAISENESGQDVPPNKVTTIDNNSNDIAICNVLRELQNRLARNLAKARALQSSPGLSGPSVGQGLVKPAVHQPQTQQYTNTARQVLPQEQTKPPQQKSPRRSRRSTRNDSSKASETGPKVEIAPVVISEIDSGQDVPLDSVTTTDNNCDDSANDNDRRELQYKIARILAWLSNLQSPGRSSQSVVQGLVKSVVEQPQTQPYKNTARQAVPQEQTEPPQQKSLRRSRRGTLVDLSHAGETGPKVETLFVASSNNKGQDEPATLIDDNANNRTNRYENEEVLEWQLDEWIHCMLVCGPDQDYIMALRDGPYDDHIHFPHHIHCPYKPAKPKKTDPPEQKRMELRSRRGTPAPFSDLGDGAWYLHDKEWYANNNTDEVLEWRLDEWIHCMLVCGPEQDYITALKDGPLDDHIHFPHHRHCPYKPEKQKATDPPQRKRMVPRSRRGSPAPFSDLGDGAWYLHEKDWYRPGKH
ncbi:hypothetical protein V1517DRAFT_341250 [Lipomyces orientalis]|uniref:Uncharacterized protein n=1 Tax=Lipomyces orientalis TaxID=1233043 RepID=A0ACC3TFJ0_9ASCO